MGGHGVDQGAVVRDDQHRAVEGLEGRPRAPRGSRCRGGSSARRAPAGCRRGRSARPAPGAGARRRRGARPAPRPPRRRRGSAPSRVRACPWVRSLAASTVLTTVRSLAQAGALLGEVRRLDPVATLDAPGQGRAAADQGLDQRGLAGAVRPHHGQPLAALQVKPTPLTSVRPGTPTSRPSDLDHDAARCAPPWGSRRRAWRSRRGASARSMRSSRFWRDAACRERVPARKRSTNRSRRAISAACLAASAPCGRWRGPAPAGRPSSPSARASRRRGRAPACSWPPTPGTSGRARPAPRRHRGRRSCARATRPPRDRGGSWARPAAARRGATPAPAPARRGSARRPRSPTVAGQVLLGDAEAAQRHAPSTRARRSRRRARGAWAASYAASTSAARVAAGHPPFELGELGLGPPGGVEPLGDVGLERQVGPSGGRWSCNATRAPRGRRRARRPAGARPPGCGGASSCPRRCARPRPAAPPGRAGSDPSKRSGGPIRLVIRLAAQPG